MFGYKLIKNDEYEYLTANVGAVKILKDKLYCKARLDYNTECCSCESKLECRDKGHECRCGCSISTKIING